MTNTGAGNVLEFAANSAGLMTAGTAPNVFVTGLTGPAYLAFAPAAAPEPSWRRHVRFRSCVLTVWKDL